MAHMIGVLVTNQQGGSVQTGGGIAVSTPAGLRIFSGVIPAVLQGRREVAQAAKVSEEAGAFSREQRVKAVMEIIAPLRTHTEPAVLGRAHYACVVQIAFGD